MTISERIEATIEGWSQIWGKRLVGWIVDTGFFVMDRWENHIAQKLSEKLQPAIAKLESSGELPPEVKPLIEEIKHPTGEIAGFLARQFGGGLVSGSIGALSDWILRNVIMGLSKMPGDPPFHNEKPEILLRLYWEYGYTKEWLYYRMSFHGLRKDQVDQLLNISTLRFPSEVIGPLWLRDPDKWGILWKDLEDLGIDKFRIEALKELVWQYPSPQQAITWMAHEVFEEDMCAKYGLDDESNKIDWSFMRKIGISEEVGRKHWRSHWEHPSWSQVRVMLHRGLLTEQDVYDWFRLVETPPYWRDNMTKTMYDLPGRIEVRMMAQLGLVDKAYVKDILKKDGLADEYLDVVADMNIVRGIRTDIQTRYTKGWLDSDGVRAELAAAGLSQGVQDRLYQWIVKNVKPDRTAAEKDLTKAEIVKGVKLGVIDSATGTQQLMQLGYDEDEAWYILAINVEAVPQTASTELTVRVDTIRRLRRQRIISREAEISELITVGLDQGLATAYADNDDLRLVKEATGGV